MEYFNKKKSVAIGQALLLISFSFAVSFIFSEYVGVVDAYPFRVPRGNIGLPPESSTPVGGGAYVTSSSGISTFVPDSALATGGGVTTSGLSEVAASQELIALGGKGSLITPGPNIASVSVAGQTFSNVPSFISGGESFVNIKDIGVVQVAKGGTGTIVNPDVALPGGHQGLPTWSPEAGGGTAPPAGIMDVIYGGKGFNANAFGALFSGLAWGATVYGIVSMVGGLLGLEKSQTKSLALASGAGVGTYQSLTLLAQNGAISPTNFFAANAGLIGLGVGVAIFVATYKKEKQELVKFECLPWEAPLGGSSCDLCNDDPSMPCSEYRCKSLGQACEIVNPGTLEEKCVWVHKDDTSAPKIEPWEEALRPSSLEYSPDRTMSPPNRGFKILQRPNGCLDPFTPLEFGITTSEPAQCRVDYGLTDKFDDMSFLLGETNLFLEEHTQKLKVPSPFTEPGGNVPEIHNEGTYNLWVRCIDANGNGQNAAAVAFSFCVQPGPDVSPPQIVGTSIESGQPVRFNSDEIPIEVYVNEPADCKWSKQDKDFDVMENEMTCLTESYQINADLNYVCSGRLSGLKNREDNQYYFRCEDFSTAPGGRNEMSQSHQLLLRGSEELIINSVSPTGQFSGSTTTVEVILTAETSHGADNGVATCYIASDPTDSNNFIPMQDTRSYTHNQSLFLPSGDYTYYFRCIDAGGNVAEDSTTFNVFVDNEGPIIARVFKDGGGLKVITSEEAECAYSLSTCNFNFEDGLPMISENPQFKDVHFAKWDVDSTYHVKCKDMQGNQPPPDQCSIVAKGSEL